MHSHSVEPWRHEHVFLGASHVRNERRTWIVIGLTAVMMAGEIIAGLLFGSMALLADGFHMATHAGALTITAIAYLYARRQVRDERFTFSTGKLGELAAYTSAIILAVISLLIGFESAMRLMAPVPIRFDEAIMVAVVGLAVNLVSAWVLQDGSGHAHPHDHGAGRRAHSKDHGHDHRGGEDNNLRAAYFHVLADALTSVLAIVALLVGRFYGWVWMDPLMGIIGSLVIARWSWSVLKGAGAVLLDTVPDKPMTHRILKALEQNGDRVADLHLWRVGPGHLAAIISVISDHPQTPEQYKAKLLGLPNLSHVTVEVHACTHLRQAI
jgi:cation diffusion facilitator family transporter